MYFRNCVNCGVSNLHKYINTKYFIMIKKRKNEIKTDKNDNNLPGYPLYPADEDIYGKYEEKHNLNSEDYTSVSEQYIKPGKPNVRDFDEDVSGSDLDIPGTELDDDQENIGSEDEENNYYSLGGDNHEDLEDDKGELNI
jgi:hypothetical protein